MNTRRQSSFDRRRHDRHKQMMAVDVRSAECKPDAVMRKLDGLAIKHQSVNDDRSMMAKYDDNADGIEKRYLALRRDALIFRLMAKDLEVDGKVQQNKIPTNTKPVKANCLEDQYRKQVPFERRRETLIKSKIQENFNREQNKRIKLRRTDCINLLKDTETHQDKKIKCNEGVFYEKSRERIMQAVYGGEPNLKVQEISPKKKEKRQPVINVYKGVNRSILGSYQCPNLFVGKNQNSSTLKKDQFHIDLLEKRKESIEKDRYKRSIQLSQKHSESTLLAATNQIKRPKLSKLTAILQSSRDYPKTLKSQFGNSLDIHKPELRRQAATYKSRLPSINPSFSMERSHSRWDSLKSPHNPKPESSVMAIEAWSFTKTEGSLLSDIE